MARVTYGEDSYDLLEGESVLSALLRQQVAIPNSCHAGVCQSCLMQAVEGELPENSQSGLKQTQILQSYFLACQCVPQADLNVVLPSLSASSVEAEILARESLCHDVAMIRLQPLAAFTGYPGQYLSLIHGDVIRSYSIANRFQEDGFIELQVRKIPGGKMSTYLHDEAKPGDLIRVRGPSGDCFYHAEGDAQDFPILLAGTSTGLAPLQGILLDAVAAGHRGTITLMHGVLREADLYNAEKLSLLAGQHPTVSYRSSVLELPDAQSLEAMVRDYLQQADKARLRLYLCGAPELVNKLKVSAFLAGVSSKNIFSDPFLPSQSANA